MRAIAPGAASGRWSILTYHPGLVGIATATHTGWLRHDGPGETVWVPHTRHALAAPPNKTLLLLGNGAATRWGHRQGRSDRRRPDGPRSAAAPPRAADT